jgi:hypothetical protein
LTVSCDKTNGTKTEVSIHRALEDEFSFPAVIENLTVSAKLFRDKYEERELGRFEIKFENLKLISDYTEVNTADTVIGPLRYLVCGEITASVYNEGTEALI